MSFKVMVVDDETPIRNWIVNMVRSMPKNFEVCAQARDGEEALRKFENSRPDLVLADIQMPKMNGLQLLGRIKQTSPETEVVILSNYDDFAYVKESFKEGVAEYFLKSEFSRDTLLNMYEILESRKKRKNIAHIHQAIKNQFIYRLLKSKDIGKQDIQALLKTYEISLSDRAIAGLEIYIPESSEANEVISGIEGMVWGESISHINIFLIAHPLRIVILFNINTVSTAERDIRYQECIRQIFSRMALPVGSSEVLNGVENIQKIVKQCDAAIIRKSFKHDEAADFYEIESLCKSMNDLIAKRESKDLSGILDALLTEVRSIREFYPIQTNALLKQLYCRFCETMEETGSLQQRLRLEDEAKIRIEHASYEELARTMRELEKRYERSVSGVSEITRRVVEYITENYAEISSMQEIAENMNYNGDYLYRRFKQEMGTSFVNYLTQVRLEKAAEMMQYQNMDPAQAAEKVGYSSVSYFNKKFKEFYGQMPSAWKKQCGIRVG